LRYIFKNICFKVYKFKKRNKTKKIGGNKLEFIKNFQFGTNELLWLGYLLFNYTAVLLAYRFWGKVGLLIFVPLSVVLANIQVLKMMTLFGVDTTMGNIAFGGVFLVSDILSEIEGKKYAKKLVTIGFITMVFTTIVMNWALAIKPAPIDQFQEHLKPIFGLAINELSVIRITAASMTAFIVSQLFDVWAYQIIRKWRPSFGDIWIRNNLSTVVGQIIDNSLFTVLAFAGVYKINELFVIAFSTYFLELFISVMDTPFVYIAALWKKQGKIKELEQYTESEYY